MDTLEQQISDILFELDPAGTCCKENDCLDEYDAIAIWIADDITDGEDIKNAIESNYLLYFNVFVDSDMLEQLYEKLKEVV